MGKEMRSGHVLSSVSKASQTMRCRASSPARSNGVCGESTRATPQVGVRIASAFAIRTSSKLTKRNSGWLLFQSTIAGPSTPPTDWNQFVFIV